MGSQSPSANPPFEMVSTKFSLCAFRDDRAECTLEQNSTDPTKMHDILTKRFGVDGENFLLTFHRGDEPCFISRPLSDLIYLHGSRINDETLCLHTFVNTRDIIRHVTGQFMSGTRSDEASDFNPSRQHGNADPYDELTSNHSGGGSRRPARSDRGTAEIDGGTTSNNALKGGQASNAPAEIQVNVRFEAQPVTMSLDPLIWGEMERGLPQSIKMNELIAALREDVERNLRNDSGVLARAKRFAFQLNVQLASDESRYANPDPYGAYHILKPRDLFTSISKNTMLPIVITLTESEDASKSVDSKEVIVNFWDDQTEYYRLGTLQVREPVGSDGSSRGSQQYTMLVYYEDVRRDVKHIRFNKVPTWNVNDIEIGDSDTGNAQDIVPEHITFDSRYGDNTVKAKIHKFLERQHENEADIDALKKDLPRLPMHCLNDLDSDMDHVGMEWPKGQKAIAAAGPFVHFDNNNRRNETLRVPETFQINIKEHHIIGDIYDLLDTALRRKVGGKKQMEDLFKRNKRRFKYDLWVLPQKGSVSKIFRYNAWKVTKFMTPAGVKAQDALYMEAHVIPIDVDERAEE